MAAGDLHEQPLDAVTMPVMSSMWNALGLQRYKDDGDGFYEQMTALAEYYEAALTMLDEIEDATEGYGRDLDKMRDFYQTSLEEVRAVLEPLRAWLMYAMDEGTQ